MTDLEKAKELFRDEGLAFPAIPNDLAVKIKEQGRWLYSSREITISPYNLDEYVHEVDEAQVDDYIVLSHSGHGANSYAIQYYVLNGPLRLFLHLGWGGAYMDAEASAALIRDCFLIADQIVSASQRAAPVLAGERLTVVVSDTYGSYWLPPGVSQMSEDSVQNDPLEVLNEVLAWLTTSRSLADRL